MINADKIIKLTNRDTGSVGYSIPEMHINRTFHKHQSQSVTFKELQQLWWQPGGEYLLTHYLKIEDAEAVAELLGSVEPEYNYTDEQIKDLLLNGSLDEVKDFLDFAPEGGIDIMKDLAVKLKINDLSKREAIQESTGFNVSMAIKINKETAEAANENEKTAPTRRVKAEKEEAETSHVQESAPTRRVKVEPKREVTSTAAQKRVVKPIK